MLLGTQKMRPTFFIGLGGSGGRVVDVLARRLVSEPTWPRYKDLVHFAVVDTDANDLARLSGRIQKTNIAATHKPRRIALFRGEAQGTQADGRVTSWVHPWYRFREASNAGAGQIRLEARFSLHCQLAEATHNGLKQILRRQLQQALRAQSPNRTGDTVRFFIYASTAGGTGSGASLTTAALVRSLCAELGAECEVFGTFFLPSLFRDKVAQPLVPKINANGYAALKEIERFQELRYEGGPDDMELVFDPTLTEATEVDSVDYVRTAPFDWVYVLDRPEAMAIEQIYAAAGEAAYLQLFSPILGYQEREGDNFRQLQMQLAAGYFALQYGSIGASVVELPRRRLERWFARQWTISALERLVVARGEGEHAVDPTDEAFKALSETEQNRRLDAAFQGFVRHQARHEADDKQPGIFSEIAAFESHRTNVLHAFRERLRAEVERAEDAIDIDSVNAASITPENTSLNAARDNLGRDFAKARRDLADLVATLERDVASGAFLARFFDDHRCTPLMQRFLLIELDRGAREDLKTGGEDDAELVDWCLNPYEDADSGRYLALRPPDPATYKVDSPEVRKQIQLQEQGLVQASRKLLKRDTAFAMRRQSAVGLFNSLRDAARDALVIEAWQRICRALQTQIEQRLEVFRVISKKGMALVSHLREQAERCRLHGLETPDIGAVHGDTTEFHLGSEVFHDERAGVRQWDAVYRLVVEPHVNLDTGRVLAEINTQLEAAATDRARKTGATDQVLQHIATALDTLARERVSAVLAEDHPLTLGNGLLLEARLAALHGHPHVDLDTLETVKAPDIEAYLREKVGRVAAMSRPLGRFDEPVLAGKEVTPYRPLFYGVDPAELRANPLLGDALGMAVSGFERLEDWGSPDILSFYQACLGVPLYAWRDVTGPLARSYESESHDPRRREPMHIDHRWENAGFNGAQGPGLPDLDPARRQVWERARADASRAALGDLARCLAAEVVERSPGGRWRWQHRGKIGDLAGTLGATTVAFAGLSDGLRGPLRAAADERLARHPELVTTAESRLAGLRFDAEADGHVLEAAAIADLITALRATTAQREADAA